MTAEEALANPGEASPPGAAQCWSMMTEELLSHNQHQ